MKKVSVKKVSERYILELGSVKIGVEKQVYRNALTITRHDYFNEPLVFKESTDEMCEAIGKLLIQASKLGNK